MNIPSTIAEYATTIAQASRKAELPVESFTRNLENSFPL